MTLVQALLSIAGGALVGHVLARVFVAWRWQKGPRFHARKVCLRKGHKWNFAEHGGMPVEDCLRFFCDGVRVDPVFAAILVREFGPDALGEFEALIDRTGVLSFDRSL